MLLMSGWGVDKVDKGFVRSISVELAIWASWVTKEATATEFVVKRMENYRLVTEGPVNTCWRGNYSAQIPYYWLYRCIFSVLQAPSTVFFILFKPNLPAVQLTVVLTCRPRCTGIKLTILAYLLAPYVRKAHPFYADFKQGSQRPSSPPLLHFSIIQFWKSFDSTVSLQFIYFISSYRLPCHFNACLTSAKPNALQSRTSHFILSSPQRRRTTC